MDMKIAGSGQIGPGEYENVRISGSGKLSGMVRCESFHVSGSGKGEALDCKNELKISGSCAFEKDVHCGSLGVSGSFTCGGNLTAEENFRISGAAKAAGSVKCGELHISGSLRAGGDVEAETVKVSGLLNCDGLLNAEEITIRAENAMTIGSIGGSKVAIYQDKRSRITRLPLLSSLIHFSGSKVQVTGSIEADTIALENVKCPTVAGRIVAIGEGCEIDLVQYSEQVEVSEKAKVGRTAKI